MARPAIRLGVLLGVLGVVYGDIGTSPLYALKACLDHFTSSPITSSMVLGILSLMFWSLLLIVTVKYVALVMRADKVGAETMLARIVAMVRVMQQPPDEHTAH